MANDESSTLLDNPREQRDVQRTRRSQVVRVLVGVVAAAVLVVGSVIAVDAIGDQHERSAATADIAELDETVPSPENVQLEAQFGWKTISSGWCSLRASTECLFSKDKQKCKDEVYKKCAPDAEESEEHEHDGSGSGSGSGSHHDGPEVGGHRNGTHKKHHKKRHHKKKHTEVTPAPTSA